MAEEFTRADIVELLGLVREAVDGIGALAESITAQDRRTRRMSALATIVAVAVLFIGGLSLSNRAVIAAIEDCTQPTGQCYQESQRRTAGVVSPVMESLGRIESRSERNLRLLCAGIEGPRPPECPAS